MSGEMKPCPFCDGSKSDPILIDHRTDWFVRCNGCNVIVYGETVNHLDHVNDEEDAQAAFDAVDWDALRQTAIDKWNARAPSATQELLRLKELECEELAKDKEALIATLRDVTMIASHCHTVGVRLQPFQRAEIEDAKQLLDRLG